VNFDFPAESEAFRAEFRSWLDANLPDALRGTGESLSVEAGSPELTRRRVWYAALAEAR
jgi:hypothetical protein